jgi:hypothetical protein
MIWNMEKWKTPGIHSFCQLKRTFCFKLWFQPKFDHIQEGGAHAAEM